VYTQKLLPSTRIILKERLGSLLTHIPAFTFPSGVCSILFLFSRETQPFP